MRVWEASSGGSERGKEGSVTRNNYRAPSVIIQIMVPQVEFRDLFLNLPGLLGNCRSGRLIVLTMELKVLHVARHPARK